MFDSISNGCVLGSLSRIWYSFGDFDKYIIFEFILEIRSVLLLPRRIRLDFFLYMMAMAGGHSSLINLITNFLHELRFFKRKKNRIL